MTKEHAEQLGYKVIVASPFEIGLVKGEQGIRTWWVRDFNGELPPLNHPLIQKAIDITENALTLLNEATRRVQNPDEDDILNESDIG
jgi:hypothetical protein